MIENKLPLYLKLSTTQEFTKRISTIDTFKGKWSEIEQKETRYLKELKRKSSIDSSGSSMRMDGSKLTDLSIEKILLNSNVNNLTTTEEQKVFGFREALTEIQDKFATHELTESYLGQLHEQLLKYCVESKNHRGLYKKHSNKVIVENPDSEHIIVFDTTKPKFVQKEITELIQWVNFQITNHTFHPIVIIATFLYEFLSIHPFQDSNGILSKLLITLLLIKQDYTFVKYNSLAKVFEYRKNIYYEVLKKAQQNRNNENENIEDWLIFFLDCIEELIKSLESKYNLINQKSAYLNERQKKLNHFISINQPVKISDIEKSFPNYSRNTLKKDLIYLRNENLIEKIGQRRGTVYVSE